MDFTFSSSIPEDDPYSVTKTKNNSGEEQKVVHEVLITKFSHAIAFSIKVVKLLIFHIYLNPGRFCMTLNLQKESHCRT